MKLKKKITITIILIFAVWGMKKGFAKAVLGVGSFIISIMLAFALYEPVSMFLKDSVVGEYVSVAISNAIVGEETKEQEVSEESKTLNLPEEISKKVTEGLTDIKNTATKTVSDSVTHLALNIISMLAVFIIVKIIMWLLTFFVDAIAKLPVIRTLNKTLGGVLGVIYGVLLIYIIMAILTFVTTVNPQNSLVKDVSESAIASKMYNDNFIVNFIGIGEYES